MTYMNRKVVFITGASRGIGLSTAQKFSKEGWNVAAFYKTNAGPEIPNCKYYQMDVTKLSEIKDAFSKAFNDFGQIDCLVNNAGIFAYKKGLAEFDEETIDNVIAVNEKGVYLCTKVALENMTRGSIVNVSSTVALVGGTDPIYSGTKAALLGFTKSMAKVVAPKIRVNAVAPSATNTDMMKNYNEERKKQLVELSLLKRMAEPEDIADGIYFLASDQAKHITGVCLNMSGGYVLS